MEAILIPPLALSFPDLSVVLLIWADGWTLASGLHEDSQCGLSDHHHHPAMQSNTTASQEDGVYLKSDDPR